jgi:hypothetical protein
MFLMGVVLLFFLSMKASPFSHSLTCPEHLGYVPAAVVMNKAAAHMYIHFSLWMHIFYIS